MLSIQIENPKYSYGQRVLAQSPALSTTILGVVVSCSISAFDLILGQAKAEPYWQYSILTEHNLYDCVPESIIKPVEINNE